MHFLQRQIRLCSTRIAQPLEKAIDFDENVKVIDIPASAYHMQSEPIKHDTENGQLFKVKIYSHNPSFVSLSLFHYFFSI